MYYAVTAAEMQQMDRITSEVYGMDSMVLMERAALCVVTEIQKRFAQDTSVLVVAGTGNNGGDGIAIARLLGLAGYKVSLFVVEGNRYSENHERQLKIYQKYGLPQTNRISVGEYDIIVDAIFGVGINRSVEGNALQAIQEINASPAYTISVDLPSGIDSDHGTVMGDAVNADLTIALGFYKRGQVLYEGRKRSGELLLADIGITLASAQEELPSVRLLSAEDIQLPNRAVDSNKGTCGKIVIIAGSPSISGAAILSARAALRSGAGMVKIITPIENRTILATAIPEALLTCYDDVKGQEDFLLEEMRWGDVILAGPGIGTGTNAAQLLHLVLEEMKQPLVLDADALNLIAGKENLKKSMCHTAQERNVILTPHLMEFSRLTGLERSILQTDIFTHIADYIEKTGTITIVKDARTIIGIPGKMLVTMTGNSMLATAGTGDVLAGLLAGLLAQNRTREDGAEHSAWNAVLLHGLTAERVSAQMKNEYSGIAGDLCDALSETIGEYTK